MGIVKKYKKWRSLRGFDKVLKNLHKEMSKVEGRTLAGLLSAVALVRTEMDKSVPKIPVKYNNLRQSWFVVSSNGKVNVGASPSFNLTARKKDANMAKEHADLTSRLATACGKFQEPTVLFGFSANYTTVVHEMTPQIAGDIKWTRPGSGPKFFQSAIDKSRRGMLKRIADYAKVR